MSRRITAVLGAVLATLVLLGGMADAGEAPFPRNPIRLVITHSPGGVNDTAGRLVQPHLQEALGVPVVVENMPGAGGNVSRAYVYAQPPDGYTLLVSLQPSMSAGQIVTGAKFETLKLTHVYNITGGNYDGVAVPFDSPFKSIDDLKKASQSQSLTSAGSGIGTNPYILAMLLKSKAGINLIFVPFNSGSEAALAVAGGQTQMGTAQVDSLWPLHEAKMLRILAVGGPERDKSHPEFPALVELGYPDIKIDSMIGIFGPPGIPRERLDVLAAGFRKAMANPKLHAAAKTAGISLQPMEPAEFYKASSALFHLVKEMEPLLKPTKR